ncbi:MAG: hypothetical protein AB7V04_00445 [Desulfomonilaceae bacterium]
MYQRSFFNVLLFLASMIITGALIFGISGCTPQEKKAEPVQQTTKAEPAPLPPLPANLPISVDFNNVPLSEVAQFITSQTGKGLILSGNEAKPLSWVESNLAKETLFDSFKAAVTASGLVLQPANDQETLFTVTQPEEPKTPVLLDFAQSSKGVFFLLGSTIYPLEKFPYPVRYDSGHWYALLPKSISDQKKSSSKTEKL